MGSQLTFRSSSLSLADSSELVLSYNIISNIWLKSSLECHTRWEIGWKNYDIGLWTSFTHIPQKTTLLTSKHYTANSLKLVLRKKILVSRIIFLKSSKIISSLLQDNYFRKIIFLKSRIFFLSTNLVSRIIFLKWSKLISSLLQDNYLDEISWQDYFP